MARIVRSEAEADADRLFILGLVQKGGADLTAVEAAALLNERRARLAREAALAQGKPQAEADKAAQAATLTVQTVRRDLRTVVQRVRLAADASAALFLDEQLQACQDDIDDTYRLQEMILDDLERSREIRWTRTVGAAPKKGEAATPATVVMHRQETAARADLYGRFIANSKHRQDLRKEQRLLKFGRARLPAAAAEKDPTFASLVTKLSDPTQAKEAALALLAREMGELLHAEDLPLPPELVALERMRLAGIDARVRQLREYVRRDVPGEDGKTFEFVYEVAGAPAAQGEGTAADA